MPRLAALASGDSERAPDILALIKLRPLWAAAETGLPMDLSHAHFQYPAHKNCWTSRAYVRLWAVRVLSRQSAAAPAF